MIYTSESAYCHSFSPVGTGRYVIDMVESGWDPRDAIRQAAAEHGLEQAEEFAAACRGNLVGGKPARTVKGWLRVARRALASMD